MKLSNSFRGALQTLVAVVLCAAATGNVLAEPGCRTGAVAVARAYVHSNPIYALFYGDLQAYVSQNRAHFAAGSPAVRCAAALSSTFMSSSVQLVDPGDIQRKQRIDAELGSIGISPGQPQPTASSTLYGISIRLARIARSLPAAARGDYGPWNTPTNDVERMQIFAEAMLGQLLQDPSMRSAFTAQEQLIRQYAEFEYRMMLDAARRLGGQ